VTGTTLALGDGVFPQTGGQIIIRTRSVNNMPANGATSILYYSMPTEFTKAASFAGQTASVTTDTVTVAGALDNRCPVNSGTLTGNNLVPDACPYFPRATNDPMDLDGDGNTTNDVIGHCTNEWDVRMQRPPHITVGPGCLPVTNSGTIMCTDNNGLFINCGTVGLTEGTSQVNDNWYQPQNTLVFSNNYMTLTSGGLGGPTDCTGTQPAASMSSLEVPGRSGSRTWNRWTGTRTAISCGQVEPTSCN
jgi:hypothetical protein